MNYYIDYEIETGRILGYIVSETKKQGEVTEVSKEQWDSAMAFNKIIIDGKNVTFDKIDWRTPEEIRTSEINTQISEAKQYLADTGWYVERLHDPSSGKAIPEEVLVKRAEARELINTLEVELGGL